MVAFEPFNRLTARNVLPAETENVVNFGHAWRDGTLTQKLELQKLFYPDGLTYSTKNAFFEPQNEYLFQQLAELFGSLIDIGVPDGI